MQAWDSLLPGMVNWCGTLLVTLDAKQANTDYQVLEVSTAEATGLEPSLNLTEDTKTRVGWDMLRVFHFPQEGLVEPADAVEVGFVIQNICVCMCMCVYIYVCVCMYVCIYVCVCVWYVHIVIC
jgi:hypothetical protein